MPPKRKAGTKAKAGGKKAKVIDSQAAGDDVKSKMAALKAADAGKKKTAAKVDSHCPLTFASVYEDFDCMLNQTNISQNNNKYYVIQLLQAGARFYLWTRWGRVGEPGANKLDQFGDPDDGKKAFGKKFTDKTKNKWENRDNFVPAAGKYTLIEVEDGDEEEIAETVKKLEALDETDSGIPVSQKVAACTLDTPTQKLMKLIFDNDMFKEQMTKFELDVKKMPLGKLSKGQIAKGFEALEEIEEALKKKKPKSHLAQLTSKFYTLIPHSFGRKIPPTIDSDETVRMKMDMLLVLADIEVAQSMQKEKDKKAKKPAGGEVPHPLDVNYDLLKCKLEHVSPKAVEYKVIDKYVKATKSGWREPKLLNVWTCDREGEDKRFSTHEAIDNRRLLWHGTNVAVVAAILKSGLRIMPHSGGRVGRGIYFASEHSKSAGYVGCTNNGTGIMFLNEVALGKEHHIKMDNGSLRAAPKGFDCIIAKGRTEPDPKQDTTMKIDGKKVVVPQGKPIAQSKFNNSNFSQSEYLVYKESQNRMRYLLEFKLY
ncbi:LOW QUALITY PROTEIN: protein mono-ADP-ribosyltransferase PARP3-like [Amphiura filiformis]|uniref:LOW QUALITY PROTEIN: protein mono-ADP-ribosyltransferase PARP3-like n=1 Tax=Amphiura filiformis TaxID=82378 RepID=UPI003B21C8AA